LNVGSGGGAAAAAPSGGAAAGGDAAAEEKPAEKEEEGKSNITWGKLSYANPVYSQGGVRRGYGFRSFRLSVRKFPTCSYECMSRALVGVESYWAGRGAYTDKQPLDQIPQNTTHLAWK
jgi:hypothetical protein